MNYLKCVQAAAGIVALVLVASASSPVHGEEAELLTDRPDFTETSFVVGRGRLQLEGGLTGSWANTLVTGIPFPRSELLATFSGPELLLRIGLTDRLELRLGAPDVVSLELPNSDRETQLGDSYLGAKIQLGPSGAPYGFALIPAVSLPTGGDLVTSDRVDPEIVLTWSRDLGSRWSLGGIVGYADSEDGGTTFPTVSLGHSVTERLGTFVEWAGAFVEGEDEHLLHHGYTYALGANAQLDLHGGVELAYGEPDFFIGAGFAIRR